MSTNLQFRLTSAGQQAAWNASNTGISLDLTHVQFGSGNRTPTGTETALVSPQAYVAIAAGSRVAPNQIRLSAMLSGLSSFNIGEIGIWKGVPGTPGSVLFAYWSQASGYLGSKAPGVDFIFTHDMVLSDAVAAGSVNIVADTSQSAMLAMMAEHEGKADPHPQYLLPGEADIAYVKKSGDTMTGNLSVPAATQPSHAVNLWQFQSSNYGNGYIKLPGGLIIQWGIVFVNVNSIVTVSLPVAFPNIALQGFCTYDLPSSNTKEYPTCAIEFPSKSQARIGAKNAEGTSFGIRYLVIGY